MNPPKRAMVIMAHPDDPEFFSGGLIYQWCQAGTEITYLILTNGNKGSDDPTMTHDKLTAIRKEEQKAAAELLGVKHVVFFDENDGELQPTLDLRLRVVTEIRRYRPEAIIAQDPTRFFYRNSYINHADHRAAGEIVADAIFPAARNRMYHPELLEQGLEPHVVDSLFLSGTEYPNLRVDITEFYNMKEKAVSCHQSQLPDPKGTFERLKGQHHTVDEYGQTVLREEYRVMLIGNIRSEDVARFEGNC